MKIRYLFLLILFFLTTVFINADIEEFYDEVARLFSVFEDVNSGLTVFPTLLIPMGGNLEGMGTAYTAVAQDSGFMDANPAASSMLVHPEFSLLHHSWISDSNIEGIVYTFNVDNLGLGVGGKFLFLPFTAYGSWGERESTGYISETVATLNIAYNFFSDFYFHGLALGTNLKLAYKNVPDAIYPGQSAVGIMADFGFLTRFDLLKFFYSLDKNFSLGAAIKNLGPPVNGEPLPTIFSAGLAYAFIKPVTLSVDFNLPISLDPGNFPAAHWYFASGMNINFTNFLSMQAGIRIKENPMVSWGCTLEFDGKSITANYNLDLSGSLNPLDKFSVEVKIKLGYKERMLFIKQRNELFARGIDAYARGDYNEAISIWEQLLQFDPKFTVVQKYIKTARAYLKSQTLLEEKQKLLEAE